MNDVFHSISPAFATTARVSALWFRHLEQSPHFLCIRWPLHRHCHLDFTVPHSLPCFSSSPEPISLGVVNLPKMWAYIIGNCFTQYPTSQFPPPSRLLTTVNMLLSRSFPSSFSSPSPPSPPPPPLLLLPLLLLPLLLDCH